MCIILTYQDPRGYDQISVKIEFLLFQAIFDQLYLIPNFQIHILTQEPP
jgi:hypothetical protein